MPPRGPITEADVHAPVPTSFAEAYREHAARVARWAARLSGSDGDVDDVVQEVFLVVSRKWQALRGDGDGNFLSWLFQVTRKIVANQRRRLRWRRLWSGHEALADVPNESPDLDDEVERRRMVALFHRAIDRLPEKPRTVFVLFELEGMSTAAIAELMQRNPSTVKVQLARARQRFVVGFRRLLRRECGERELELGSLAAKIVRAGAEPPSRLGKKTS
jgi:RNA polymerase sigma-70 factor, ECF subfamily